MTSGDPHTIRGARTAMLSSFLVYYFESEVTFIFVWCHKESYKLDLAIVDSEKAWSYHSVHQQGQKLCILNGILN